MAEKRMFSMKIVDTDAFLDMPATTQNLYFHYGMRADDDGFVGSPKRIRELIKASEDDYKLLIAKKFIIPFESGICVIKHWRINNYLRSDRYTETTYIEEKSLLKVKENGVYSLGIPSGIPLVDVDKSSIDKSSIDKSRNTRACALGDLVNNSNLPEKIKEALKEWLKYKKYNYQDEGFKKLITIVGKKISAFGIDAVCDLIDECMANTWKGIIWDKLKFPSKSEPKKYGDGSKYAKLS